MGNQREEALDLRAIARGQVGKPQAKRELVPRTRELVLQYEDPKTGDLLTGSLFVSILDRDQRRTRGQAAASMVGAVWEWVPVVDRSRAFMLATVAAAMDANRAPDWIYGALEEDDELLELVYQEVEAHRALYFRANVGSSGRDEGRPRMVVSPADAASTSRE